jgi:integrase
MTGTINARKSRPNYFIILRYKDEVTGSAKTKTIATDIPVKGNNKRKAEAKLKELLAEYENPQVDFGKDILFTEFIKEWLENLKPSISPVTYDGYHAIVYTRIIPFFEPKKLKVRDLTPMHIQRYINFRLQTVSPNTVKKHLWNISKCLNSAVKHRLIATNPVKLIDMPQKVKYTGAKFYTEEQLNRLQTAAKGDIIEPIVLFASFYGLRRSEILGLKWDAIDFDNNTFTIKHTVIKIGKNLHKRDSTKNKSSYRVMPLSKQLRGVLKALRYNQLQNKLLQPNDYIDEGYVFTHADGRLVLPHIINDHFNKILARNGLPHIRFHDLRHSSASYLLRLGFSMKELQMWLGHGDMGTTMNIYAHLDVSVKRNIADTLDEKFSGFGKNDQTATDAVEEICATAEPTDGE